MLGNLNEEEKSAGNVICLTPNSHVMGLTLPGSRYVFVSMAIPDAFDWILTLVDNPTVSEHNWRLAYDVT